MLYNKQVCITVKDGMYLVSIRETKNDQTKVLTSTICQTKQQANKEYKRLVTLHSLKAPSRFHSSIQRSYIV